MPKDQWPPDVLEVRGEGLQKIDRADLRDINRFLSRHSLEVTPVWDPEPEPARFTPDYIEEIGDQEEWFINRLTFRRAGKMTGYNSQFVSATFSKLVRIIRPSKHAPKTKSEEPKDEQLPLDIATGVEKIRVILPGEKPELDLSPNDALLSINGLCAALVDKSIHTTRRKPNGIGEKSVVLIEDVVKQFILPEHRQ